MYFMLYFLIHKAAIQKLRSHSLINVAPEVSSFIQLGLTNKKAVRSVDFEASNLKIFLWLFCNC